MIEPVISLPCSRSGMHVASTLYLVDIKFFKIVLQSFAKTTFWIEQKTLNSAEKTN